MKTHDREIQIYYNSSLSSHRSCVAHAQSLSSSIKTYDFAKTPSNSTSWRQILKSLDIHPKDLLDKSLPYYREHIKGRDFNMTGWLEIIRKNPTLLRAPIAMRGDKAIFCERPTDIYKLTQAPAAAAV